MIYEFFSGLATFRCLSEPEVVLEVGASPTTMPPVKADFVPMKWMRHAAKSIATFIA